MRQRAAALVAAGGIALGLAPAAWAPLGAANVGVTASFDRRSVARGQVAVATIELAARGTDPPGPVTVEATVDGGRLLRGWATGGSCGRPAGASVRCTFGSPRSGQEPSAVVHALAADTASAVRLTTRVVRTGEPDGNQRDDVATAAVRIVSSARPLVSSELSFTFTAPADAVVGARFAGKLRLLNRGPHAVVRPAVHVEVRPRARVVLAPLPRRLGVGEERVVNVAFTPLTPGRLSVDVLVGADGRGHTTVRVGG